MEDFTILSSDIAREIVKYKNEKWEQENLSIRFPNKILRGDVLDILDNYCTVIYYPIDNESNNGFQLTGITDASGNDQHFVFINTAQTMEKQVFTAAHELGHLWKVDEYIEQKCTLKHTNAQSEHIINRFAAELLIPEAEFKQMLYTYLPQATEKSKPLPVFSLIKAIAGLMNYFLVPKTAVIMRLEEIGFLSHNVVLMLLQNGPVNKPDLPILVTNTINRIIQEEGYVDLKKGSGKKWIAGLAELLDQAEAQHSISQNKIDHMRELFELTRYVKNAELEFPVPMD